MLTFENTGFLTLQLESKKLTIFVVLGGRLLTRVSNTGVFSA
jgi:hypothetical protein